VQLNKGPYFAVDVRTADLAGLRITQAVYPTRTRLPRHGHAQPYLCLVAAGGFEERLRRRSATCTPGTVIWNPSSEEHDDTFGASGGRCWNVEFTDAWGERLAQAADQWTPALSGEPAWLATRILRELAAPDAASSLALEGLVCALIGEISRTRPDERHRPLWVLRARDRLHAEYREPPNIAELAREAGVHRSHFSRAFRRYVGCTVADFVRRRRVEWAAEQLRERGYRLAELSLSAGFGDQAHFTRAFKRVTGVTPGAYRATVR
jgi:AraC family transcriptional regulator